MMMTTSILDAILYKLIKLRMLRGHIVWHPDREIEKERVEVLQVETTPVIRLQTERRRQIVERPNKMKLWIVQSKMK